MLDLLITNGTVIAMDRERRVIEKGYVAIEAGQIVGVGAMDEDAPGGASAKAPEEARQVIDAAGCAVLPGFIDTHGHAGHALTKTLGEHRGDWERFVEDIYFRCTTEDFWYAEARLAALERMKFGTTTAVSMVGSTSRIGDVAGIDAHFEGAQSIGIRIISGIGSPNPPWPKASRTWSGGSCVEEELTPQRAYAETYEVVKRWNNTNRGRTFAFVMPSRIGHAPPNSRELAIEQMQQMRRIADELGTRIHSHSYRGDIAFTLEAFPKGLGPDVLLAHCTGITPEEVKILAGTGTHVTSGPSTHSYIAARCPVVELLEAGANVTISTDGNAPDRTFDLWKELRIAQLQHRAFFHDGKVLPAGKVLEMVTVDAAKAIGMDDRLGSLEVGKRADIQVVDVNQPHLAPFIMPVQRLVYAASGQDVVTVIVDGEVLMENRVVLSVNEAGVLNGAARELELMLERGDHRDKLQSPATLWGSTRY